MADSWKDVSFETTKNCFAKWGITEQTSEDEDDIVDEEFNVVFNKLADLECDMRALCRFRCRNMQLFASSQHIYGKLESKFSQSLCAENLRKECGDLNEVASDNYDDKDDDDGDDDVNRKDIEVVEIGTGEALSSKEERNSLVTRKNKLEKKKVLNKKPSHINDYFVLE